MKSLRFSVIIPTLNEEKFLPNLLESLTRQRTKNFEVIVVDGFSHDATVAQAERFARRIRHLTIIPCSAAGVSMQRNLGAKAASADWLVFVDADSVLLPIFFDRVSEYIREKHPKFFTTWLKADGDDPRDAILGFTLNMSVEGAILIDRPWAPGPLTVIRKDIFDSVGGYDEDTSFGEDHDLSMTLHKRGIPFEVFREILYVYSLRRFRKEGSRKVIERNLKAAFQVLLTKQGPKHMPDFIGGGAMYRQKGKKSSPNTLLSRRLTDSMKKIFQELIS